MKCINRIFVFLFVLCSSACGQKTQVETQHSAAEEHAEETTIVSLSDEQMRAANIVIGGIEMKNLTTSISVNGTLEVPNQNKALVTSLSSGVLRSLNIQPGDFVKKGQVVGTIANTELSGLQQQLASISAQMHYAEQEQRRQRELVAGNAAPLKNVQKAEAELNSLRAQRSALLRQLSALGASTTSISNTLAITAPISGTISEITAQIGSKIDANASIAEIINNSELHLDLYVYEKDLPKVAPGQTIHFTLTNSPGKEYDARVYSIGTAFMNETKAVPVHAHVINNKSGLIEGMSVTARISLGQSVYPAVPDEAIINNSGNDYIFIVTDKKPEHSASENDSDTNSNEAGSSFQRIQVIKGASDVGYTQIRPIETLPNDTKVAIKGAFFLMAKMTNTGEHEH